jgi:hypothetical protein
MNIAYHDEFQHIVARTQTSMERGKSNEEVSVISDLTLHLMLDECEAAFDSSMPKLEGGEWVC